MTFILHLDNSIHSRCSEFVASYVGIERSLFKYNSRDELDCKLPACVLKDQSLVVSGLCHVSRQAIKFSCCRADSDSERKKLEALLVCNIFYFILYKFWQYQLLTVPLFIYLFFSINSSRDTSRAV